VFQDYFNLSFHRLYIYNKKLNNNYLKMKGKYYIICIKPFVLVPVSINKNDIKIKNSVTYKVVRHS
jgi:hypothetical protein